MGSTKYPLLPPPGGGTPNLPGAGQPAPMRPEEFAPGSVANRVTFGFDNVGPPSPLYVQRDDQLLLQVMSTSGVAESVTFNIRFLRVPEPQGGQPDQGGVGKSPGQIITRGIIQWETEVIPGLAGLVLNQVVKQMAEGYLLSVGAVANAAVGRGSTFVRAMLRRGNPGAALPQQGATLPLFADYSWATSPVGWPGGRVIGSPEGPGLIKTILVTVPGAGAEWTQTVTTGHRWRVLGVNAQLVTSAAVANRVPQIQLQDNSGSLWHNGTPNQSVPASQTVQVTGTSSMTTAAANVTNVLVALPGGNVLGNSWIIKSLTLGIQAADQYSAIILAVEEWIDFT